MKNKKSFIEWEVMKIILILFSFILLFAFLYRFYSKSTEFAGEEACHDSLVLTQTLAEKVATGQYLKPWPATCKTKEVVSKATEIDQAKKELAERMSWCWWMMGEGVIKPFDKDFFAGGKKCYVCYTMQFPFLKEPVSRQDFMYYLQQQGKEKMTYYDYLKYGEDKVIESPLTDPIDSKKIYAVVYTSPSDFTFNFILTCLKPSLEVGAGAATTGAVVCGTAGAVVAGPPGAAAGVLFCGLTGAVWGSIGTYALCAPASIVTQIIEKTKEDLVYVTDVNRGQAGCEGTWYKGVGEVQTA
ncbi:hypothetical protein COV19_06490 [Candidatus Woesearchaeota archaeon CG10_big_fil_rev_8_21_14_0_10_44_13]|nr:MAG: hypothetical protein COV19_06490 [Candidatus Woesearchaeota archaeon CG10_big_fil_rev_8_21_14_0_10_44_13]